MSRAALYFFTIVMVGNMKILFTSLMTGDKLFIILCAANVVLIARDIKKTYLKKAREKVILNEAA